MNDEFSMNFAEKIISQVCENMRGALDPSSYQEFALALLFLKCIADISRDRGNYFQIENQSRIATARLPSFFFELPERANFYFLYKERYRDGNGERIENALHIIDESKSELLRGVFRGIGFNSSRLGDERRREEVLCSLLESFGRDEFDLRPSRFDRENGVGSIYELLVKSFAMVNGKKQLSNYTPPELALLLSALVEPQEGDAICDPACGTGSLLLKCADQIMFHNDGSRNFSLCGQEINGSTWAIARINLLLHGIDNQCIKWGDSIRDPKLLDGSESLRKFDVIVSNPPISVSNWGEECAANDRYARFDVGMPPRSRADYAFILHMIKTLKPKGGRMATIVSHGVLFRGASEGDIRQKLIENDLIEAVISLPPKLLYDSAIPLAIILFRTARTGDEIMFINASDDFESGKNQNRLSDAHVRKIVSTYKERTSVVRYARLVGREEIRSNGYSLNVPLYVAAGEEDATINLTALRQERAELEVRLAAIETELADCLKWLDH